tara:strand:- start:104 stop:265 length:162 start_codon:yes stop_codon:yes gene_type:complete
MSNRDKKYGGLVRYDHHDKIIFLQRNLNPPSTHARFVNKLKEEYPDYKVVSKK